jgi:hypothetical protein
MDDAARCRRRTPMRLVLRAHSKVDAGPVETGDQAMFIAMNRFRVKKGSECGSAVPF